MIVNFGYVIDNKLAGLAHPASLGDIDAALDELKNQGIGALVSLDEDGLAEPVVAASGLAYIHLPVPDFHAPQLEQARQFVAFAQQQLAEERPVAVHCHGGYGRTGTMLACYLISQGQSAAEAMNLVRQRRPGSIETDGQEDFLRVFEARLRGNDSNS